MIIYNRNGDELIDVPITSSAVRKRVLMGDNYVSLPFSHDTYIDFAPGSYIIYNGLKFEIIDVDKNRPTRNATTGGWDYTLQFDDQERHMTRAIVFWLSQKPREAVFHDTTDLQSFGNLIVENMNAFVPAKNWKMRDLSDELKEGTKLVSFNGDTCWNAVNTIAETFGVEWWTEQSEGYIYLCFGKLEIGTEEDFVEGDVITSIPSRRGDDSNYGTRFYVFGSTRNLTEDYGQADQGGTTNHVSEIRLRLPGGQEYIDARPDMAWNDVVEKFVVFEDIYPKNTDTVTSVEKVKRQTDSGTEYEARVIYAKDTPFLPTDLIPGETLQAVITSGALSGRTFDIQLGAAFDDPDTWNPETNPFDRKFEIVADVETTGEQEIIIPNDNLDIEPGNTFVLTGIKLPGARIGEAEQELLEAGTTWAQKNSKDTSVYDCPTNPVYCQLNDKSYELGQKVRLVNEAQFGSSGRSSRIQGYEKSLDNEYQATYTVGDNTAYSRLGEIEKDIQEAAYAERIGVTNGVGIYLIRAKYDQTQPTDYNAYSAAAADEKFLSRKKNDTAEGIITFAKGILANTLSSEKFVSGNEGKGHSTWIDDDGVSHTEVDQVKARKTVVSKQIEAEEGNVTELTSTNIEATVLTVLDKIIAKDQTLSGKISSAKFLSGLLGYGWMIDTQGNGELHSLSIRSFLEVPELRYNQVQVIGDELWVTAGGVISDVQAADSGRYTITLKLEEGQTNPFAADDILRGIYHVSTGFSTIQMRVDSVAEDGTMTVTPRTPDLVPQKFMNIAKTGNFTNAARQRSILISSKQGRIQFMADVNDWEIAPSMVRMILGDTSGFVHPSFGDTSGYNAFLENILMTGRIFQKSADGTTTKPVAVNKGEWEAGTYYYYDEVTHKGSLWLCTAESTSEEPSASSIDWVEEVASGSGSPGPAGPALRSRGVWSASETYINGGEFRDWVLYGEHNYRYVVKEGVATVPAGTLPTDTAYWTPFNEMEPVATRVLLADDAWIDILSTNGIRIGNNGWELTDGEIRHKTSGLKLTKDGKLVAPNGLSLVVGEENIDDYTQQKIDSVEIGTVNLIDKSEEIVLIAGATQTYAYVQKKLHVCPGDEFALSIENIGISAGNPTEFTVLIIDQNMAKELCRRILTLDNRTAVFEIPVDTEEQDGYILFYAGKAGQTNNNSVTYHKVMLVKGNRPALTWSPSLNDQKAQTQEQIDSIQVGSDNLMDDTQRPNPSNTELWNKTVSASVWGEVGEFVAVKIRGQWGRLWQSIAEGFIGGQQYRFSCWVKRDASMETTETKAQFSVGRNAVTIISATLDGVKLGAGGSTGVFSGKSLAGIVISADTFQRLECIFEASETVPGDSFRLEFYTSNYQTNTPCGVVYGYYLVKGNKATDDWRPSLNDTKKAIAAAQAAADQAKEDAAASAQKLEDWSSDELISPPEKPGLVQQKADIESEYGEIGSQADRYGIKSSTYWTAYNSAYTLAIQALTKYTASTPESIPVEADYDYIAAYYPKRQIMLDQIAAAAQAYTDGLQFGSVNLIDGSEAIKITASASATHAYLRFPLHVRPGDEFALSIGSIEILAGNPTEFSCNILTYQMDRPLAHKQLTLDNRTAVYKILEKEQEQDAWFLMYAGKETQTNGVSVIYHEVMLVKGNRPALTWSPSLNDQKAQTQEMVDASLPATRNLALKTEGQLDFDASSWAGLYLDLAEQPVIGQQYVLSWDDIQFTETSHPVIRLWINSFTGAVNLKEVTQTGSGSVVVTIPDTLLTDQTYRILFGGSDGAMTGYVKNPMWSKGNKVMPWTPAIEDAPNEIREEAKATGIYLSEKKIDVVADRFRITSTAGREIMRADADGNRVSMENLDVQAGATIGPVEVTETGLAVKAEDEDLQTVISNQEFGSLSDALGTGKTSIVALTAPSVSQPGGQFDMGTFSAPDATVRILSVSGRVIMMNGLNSVRIYLTKQVGSQWTDLGIELFSMASNSHYDENFTKSVVISSIGNYKIACTAVCGGVITISNMSGTLQEQVKRMEVRPSTIFGMLNSTQYFLLGREKPSASGSEIFRAKIQNEDGGLEVTSTGVNIDGETYIDGQTTINGNASVVGKFSATGEINATGNIQSDTDIEAVRDILIGRYLKGLAIPSEKIPSSMTSGSNYQIANSATCIDAMNKNAINITLPKNPKTGQIVLIRQYSAGYTLKGGGKQIHRAGSTVSEFWNDAYGSLMWIRFDGSYWALNYMPSL
nr:MAG TPA: Minor structural protein 4 [Caudoviricetes sp.]